MPDLCLIAQLRAAPDQGDALERVLRACVAPTRAETGNLAYHLHRDNEDPACFAFYEVWVDEAALDAHMRTPHLQRLMQEAKPLLAEPLTLHKLHRVE